MDLFAEITAADINGKGGQIFFGTLKKWPSTLCLNIHPMKSQKCVWVVLIISQSSKQ
jgi:hypothetical protein